MASARAEQVQGADVAVDEQQAMPAGLRRDAEHGTGAATDQAHLRGLPAAGSDLGRVAVAAGHRDHVIVRGQRQAQRAVQSADRRGAAVLRAAAAPLPRVMEATRQGDHDPTLRSRCSWFLAG